MADNFDDIINKIKKNSKEENKRLAQEMQNKLSAEQSRSLNKLMSDKELMKKLMASDEVKNIMSKLGGEDSGHK